MSQENIIAIQLAKNHANMHGEEKKIGSKILILGALDKDEQKEFHSKGVEIIKKGGEELLKLDGKTLIEDVLPQEEIQKELSIDSEFVPQLWYIRRCYSIAKYFSTKDERTENALLEVMVEELGNGNISETFNGKTTVYHVDTTVEEIKELIFDFQELKKELGV